MDDSSLPWGARATHTLLRADVCVWTARTCVLREPVTAMHWPHRVDRSVYIAVYTDPWTVYIQPPTHAKRPTGALWQSSPTPVPLNYSRHAVESFTQSFSYINATQRDCPPHGQFRGLAGCFERVPRRVKGAHERVFQRPEETLKGDRDGRGVRSHAEAIVFRHTGPRCVSLPC